MGLSVFFKACQVFDRLAGFFYAKKIVFSQFFY
jgi:hypothetical protein